MLKKAIGSNLSVLTLQIQKTSTTIIWNRGQWIENKQKFISGCFIFRKKEDRWWFFTQIVEIRVLSVKKAIGSNLSVLTLQIQKTSTTIIWNRGQWIENKQKFISGCFIFRKKEDRWWFFTQIVEIRVLSVKKAIGSNLSVLTLQIQKTSTTIIWNRGQWIENKQKFISGCFIFRKKEDRWWFFTQIVEIRLLSVKKSNWIKFIDVNSSNSKNQHNHYLK